MKILFRSAILIALIFSLNGCFVVTPLLPARTYKFTISFKADGMDYSLSSNYQCGFELSDGFSERDTGWHVINPKLFHVAGNLADGSTVDGSPNYKAYQQWTACPAQSGVASGKLIIQTVRDRSLFELYGNLDEGGSRNVSDINASIELIETGPRISNELKDVGARDIKEYYRVVAKLIPDSADISQETLPAYQGEQSHGESGITRIHPVQLPLQILKRGSVHKFVEAEAMPHEPKIDTFIPAKRGHGVKASTELLIGNPASSGDWEFDGKTNHINWKLLSSELLKSQRTQTVWAKYKNSRVEIPYIRYEQRVQDPEAKASVVFSTQIIW